MTLDSAHNALVGKFWMSWRSGNGTEQPRSVQDRGRLSCHKKARSGLDRGSGAESVQAEKTGSVARKQSPFEEQEVGASGAVGEIKLEV